MAVTVYVLGLFEFIVCESNHGFVSSQLNELKPYERETHEKNQKLRRIEDGDRWKKTRGKKKMIHINNLERRVIVTRVMRSHKMSYDSNKKLVLYAIA